MRRILGGLAALTLLIAGAAACGDDGGDEAATTGGQGPVEDATGPELGEHWHVAYAIEVCGELLPPSSDRGPDALGIHTHEDGLIHVHPFVAAAAGREATLQTFLDQIGAEVGADGFALDDGRTTVPTCAGDDTVRVAQWDDALAAAEGAEPDRTVTRDPGGIVLAPDLSALTIAVGPADAAVEAPPSAADICRLATLDGPTDGSTSVCEQPAPAEEGSESVAAEPCVGETVDPGDGAPEVEVPDGPQPTALAIDDQVVGDGDVAARGDRVTVDYVGVACSTGEVFDSSYPGGEPVEFPLDEGVIPGFADGIAGMAVGGRRRIVIPAELAYGSTGAPPAIAPDQSLVFVVELRSVA